MVASIIRYAEPAARGYGWSVNPWVRVVEFRRAAVNKITRLAGFPFVFVNSSTKPIEPVCECSRCVTESSRCHRNVLRATDRRKSHRLHGDIEPGKCIAI